MDIEAIDNEIKEVNRELARARKRLRLIDRGQLALMADIQCYLVAHVENLKERRKRLNLRRQQLSFIF